MIDRLAILGVGLIGGSLARALRKVGAVDEIVGWGRTPAHLEEAVRLGVIDRYLTDPIQAVQDADMVVLAVPLGAMRGLMERIRGGLTDTAVVTDVGSSKGSVIEDARVAFGEIPARFVPGHPIAGTERSGVEAAITELFQDRRVILTPVQETDPAAIGRVRAMWEATGAVVEQTTYQHHDHVLAATSHLPHMLAFSLVDALARMDDSDEIFRYAAGGFRDFSRIASSDPVMWHDICLANRAALLEALDRYRDDLDGLAEAIRGGDGQTLLDAFRRAKAARDRQVAQLDDGDVTE